MRLKAKQDYSLRVVIPDDESNLYLIKLFRGTTNKDRRKLFQFVSKEIPKVKQVIELYKYHENWHEKAIASN